MPGPVRTFSLRRLGLAARGCALATGGPLPVQRAGQKLWELKGLGSRPQTMRHMSWWISVPDGTFGNVGRRTSKGPQPDGVPLLQRWAASLGSPYLFPDSLPTSLPQSYTPLPGTASRMSYLYLNFFSDSALGRIQTKIKR